MSPASAPYRGAQPVGRDRFAQLLRAELTKFRTVRSWVAALVAAAGAFALIALLSVSISYSRNPQVPTGPDGEGVTDAYSFVHQPLDGDGTLTVRVASLEGAQATTPTASHAGSSETSRSQTRPQLHPDLAPWAKAGILIEPDTTQGTTYAAVMVTGSHGVRLQYDYTHDRAGPAGSAQSSSPRWLRLSRSGDLITSDESSDGTHWTRVGSARLAGLPTTVQIGLFVTSPDDAAGAPSVATASFDHLSLHGDLPRQAWQDSAVSGAAYPTVPSGSTWTQPTPGSFTISGTGDIAPVVGGQAATTHWSGASIVNGTIVGLVILIVVIASYETSEYRRGLIRTTLVAAPRRHRALAAQAIVAGMLALIAGAAAAAVAELVTRHVFAANGNYLFPESLASSLRVVFGTGLFFGLTAALVVALGTILRRGAATVVAGFVLVIVPGILGTSVPGADTWLMRLTPTAAFAIQATLPRYSTVTAAYTPDNGYFPISPWGGLAVMTVYTALALVTATWLLRRRDV